MTATANDIGARHAGEIEYVFGALDSVPNVTWDEADRKLSDLMMSYWSNFARSADPNGPGLPKWPGYDKATGDQVMHLDVQSEAKPATDRARYEALDAIAAKARTEIAARGEARGWSTGLSTLEAIADSDGRDERAA